MKLETVLDNIHEIHYPSPLDMLTEKPSTTANAHSWRCHEGYRHDRWTMAIGAQDFMAKTRTGWPELTTMVEEYERRLRFDGTVAASLIKQVRRRQVKRDTGDELDFDEWRRGNVDTAWRTTERHVVEQRRQRAAVLNVNIMCHAGVRPSEAFWRTAVAHLVGKKLTAAGWAVEVIVSATTYSTYEERPGEKLIVSTVAKPSTVPMSLERLALVTTVDWYRFATFLAYYATDRKLTASRTLGHCDYQTVAPYVTRLQKRGYLALTIPANTFDAHSAQNVLDGLVSQIKEHTTC